MSAQDRDGVTAAEVTIHVCLTCRHADDEGDEENRPGARLYRALAHALIARDGDGVPVHLSAVRCLSVCKRPCTIAVSGSRRWTYVYGDFDPETSAPTILEGVALYAKAPDGIVAWRDRPEAFRKGVIARIPPLQMLSAPELLASEQVSPA